MKITRLLQVAVIIIALFTSLGMPGLALAQTSADETPVIVVRNVTYWEGTLIGYVNPQLFEKWPFSLDATQAFTVTVTPIAPGFTPIVRLLDASDTEIAEGTGSIASSQPAGNYSILVEPADAGGFYQLNFRQVEQPVTPEPTSTPTPEPVSVPSVTVAVVPAILTVGDSAVVTVGLGDVPADGYTSAEFTCTYDAGLLEASGIAATGLFGTDPAVAINGPSNGSFILAVAGSNSNKATASGPAFTFSLKGLQAGEANVECKGRVSTGNNALTDVQSGIAGVVVGVPSGAGPSSPGETPTATEAPTEVPTDVTPTETPEPTVDGTLSGQVVASKPVTITLLDGSSAVVTTAQADSSGNFTLTAPAGAYTVLATAEGFLGAQASVALSSGQQSSLPPVSLPAGDIDGNHVIDEFDAMTIGMNYNLAVPAAADLNNDGVINVLDLELLAHNYRASGALLWQPAETAVTP